MKFKVKLITHNAESSMTIKKEIDELSVSVISENISMLKIEEISEASAKSIIMDDDDILVDFGEINFDESIRFKIHEEYRYSCQIETPYIYYDAYKFKEDYPESFDKHLKEYEQLRNDYLKSKNKFFKNDLDKYNIDRWNNNVDATYFPEGYTGYEEIFIRYYLPLKRDVEISRTKKIEESEKDTAERLKKKQEELKARDIEQYKEKVELLRSKGWSVEYRKEDSD